MDLNLGGKVSVVTGAGRGLGRAIALAFAREGANVVVADIDEAGAKKVAAEAQALKIKAVAVKVDVRRLEEAQKMVQVALDKFARIDALVNNAGSWVIKPFMELPKEEWQREIDINIYGVLNCTRAVLDCMIKQGSGQIVNIASMVGRQGGGTVAIYALTKAGVIGFTKSMALELAPSGIRVNAVAPGLIATEGAAEAFGTPIEGLKAIDFAKQIPLARPGKPEEVADLVVYLSSNRAAYITGQTFGIDGGACLA